MRLRRYDRSLYGAACLCKKEDAVCEFPTIGELTVPHHSYCSVYKAVRRCFYQRQFWLTIARRIAERGCHTCCKSCVCVVSMSRHCFHCVKNDRFLAAQMEAVMWGHMMHNIILRDSEVSCAPYHEPDQIAALGVENPVQV